MTARSHGLTSIRSGAKGRTPSEQSGAVTEEAFENAFEDVPSICIFSSKDVSDRLTKVRDTLTNTTLDWEKRVDALKEIRSLLVSGAMDCSSDFYQQIKAVDPGLLASVKDLRSQVVREACITIAYLSKRLESKFDFTAESVLPSLIMLLQNSAKVMATSASMAIVFIIKYTPAPRLIQSLSSNSTSKSAVIRSQCYDFIGQLLHSWPKQCLERHVATLQECVKRGLADADSDARTRSRRAFAGFAQHFPEQAASLLSSFDATRQRQLLSELPNPSIIEGLVKTTTTSRPSGSGATRSASAQRRASTDETGSAGIRNTPDLIPLSARSGLQPGSYATLGSVRKTSLMSDSASYRTAQSPGLKQTSAVSSYKSRARGGVSQSQPGSRSNSPPRQFSSASQLPPDVAAIPRPPSAQGGRIRPPTSTYRVAHSQGNSRDASPSRHGDDTQRLPASTGRSSLIRRASDFEAAVADAWRQRTAGMRRPSNDSCLSDAASETSSVCSESTYSYRSYTDISEDLAEVLTLCGSGSWTDRRDGLYGFQRLMRTNRRLSATELRRVTELFTRMFHDPHSKVFATFIDAFIDLVTVHGCDLVDWFQVCLVRLFNKVGMDVLGPLQGKITLALDAVRTSFPQDHQFSCLMRYIVEQSPTSNIKIKLAVLNYVLGLMAIISPSLLINTSDTRLAVSRFITWASEPKSPDVRKVAQSVLIAMYQLNPTEISAMLALLPRNFQDGAAKILAGMQNKSQPLKLRQIQSSPGLSRVAASHLSKASSPRTGRTSPSMGSDNGDGMNSDIYYDVRQVTADLQHLSLFGQQMDLVKGNGFDLDWLSKDGSSHASSEELSLDDVTLENIFVELSNQNDRQTALGKLLAVAMSDGTDDLWDKHFKAILLTALDLMKDDDGKIRTTSLKILKEMLRRHSARFLPYIELTIMKLLEFEKDTDKEVLRAADSCSSVIAQVMDPEQCFSVLTPVSQTAEFPINLAAIKMEEKVIKACNAETLKEMLSGVTPPLMKSFETSDNSAMRKSSMNCLVALHEKVGDCLLPLLTTLSPSKFIMRNKKKRAILYAHLMKLLNLYIQRNQEMKSSALGSSEPTSPSSPSVVGFR